MSLEDFYLIRMALLYAILSATHSDTILRLNYELQETEAQITQMYIGGQI